MKDEGGREKESKYMESNSLHLHKWSRSQSGYYVGAKIIAVLH